MSRSVWIAALCLLLAGGLWAQDADAAPAESAKAQIAPEARERLLRLLPAPLPAGAVVQGVAEFYSAETLYRYMDGGADIYALYELRAMLHQELKSGKVDVTADIFDMGVEENAFGIYAAERSPKYDFIAMGAEGYRDRGIVNFVQGRYYVKLAGFGEGVDAVLDGFARGISASIGGRSELPALLQKLPQAGRRAHSEQYLLKDPLGHSSLGPAYVATYSVGGKEGTLLVSVAPDAAAAQERMKQLTEHFRKSGSCEAAAELGAGAIRASNSFEGNAVAQVKGRYLVVLFSAAALPESVLKEAFERLQ